MKRMPYNLSQRGQLILTLILVMSVALAIGLSIIQKSLVDVSTATKVEESSRAFSAAEAGIEKYLQADLINSSCTPQTCQVDFSENNSGAKVEGGGLIPALPTGNAQQEALEFPPLLREEVAQVWLADPDSNIKLPDCTAIDPTKHAPVCYNQNTLDVFWGNSQTDKAAIELTLVFYDGTKYNSRKWYLDHTNARRSPPNGFDLVSCQATASEKIGDNQYQCKETLDFPADSQLIMIRSRLLYNKDSQLFAVRASVPCDTSTHPNNGCFLPPQARVFTSTGSSGQTQRKVRLFQQFKAIPPYFDYAIFSVGEIKKQQI